MVSGKKMSLKIKQFRLDRHNSVSSRWMKLLRGAINLGSQSSADENGATLEIKISAADGA